MILLRKFSDFPHSHPYNQQSYTHLVPIRYSNTVQNPIWFLVHSCPSHDPLERVDSFTEIQI